MRKRLWRRRRREKKTNTFQVLGDLHLAKSEVRRKNQEEVLRVRLSQGEGHHESREVDSSSQVKTKIQRSIELPLVSRNHFVVV
jgi:hypothetical protein